MTSAKIILSSSFVAHLRRKLNKLHSGTIAKQTVMVLVAALMLVWLVPGTFAQGKKSKRVPPSTELAKLRDEFIKVTTEYKISLGKLIVLYERDVTVAQERLEQSKKLYSEGLISKNQLAESETALSKAIGKVSEAERQMTNADRQIASALLESAVETRLAGKPMRRGALVRTTSYIRYNGAAGWTLAEAWKVQRFFMESFRRPLPIAVFGQGVIHDRWRLDHRSAMDVSLHPDQPEGQALLGYLRANGIPFLAFRAAIPGTATGPHIHIGRPSHRF